eukprot:gene12046-biopygen7908
MLKRLQIESPAGWATWRPAQGLHQGCAGSLWKLKKKLLTTGSTAYSTVHPCMPPTGPFTSGRRSNYPWRASLKSWGIYCGHLSVGSLPKGCMQASSTGYFNQHVLGQAHAGAAPICVIVTVAPAADTGTCVMRDMLPFRACRQDTRGSNQPSVSQRAQGGPIHPSPHGHPRLGCTFLAFVGFVGSPEGEHDPCWSPRLAALLPRRRRSHP